MTALNPRFGELHPFAEPDSSDSLSTLLGFLGEAENGSWCRFQFSSVLLNENLDVVNKQLLIMKTPHKCIEGDESDGMVMLLFGKEDLSTFSFYCFPRRTIWLVDNGQLI